MTACGYTPDEIDAMSMADVLALLLYWKHSPPTHDILAAVHRIEPARRPSVDPADPSGVGAIIARHPDGRVKA